MQINPAKIHIFKNCSEIFETLLELFNQYYCEEHITKGIAYNNNFFDVMKFETKNPLKKFIFSNLVAKINEGIPLIQVLNKEDNYIKCECKIFSVEDFLIGGFFMIQNTFPIEGSDKYKFNIWKLGSKTFSELDDHWL